MSNFEARIDVSITRTRSKMFARTPSKPLFEPFLVPLVVLSLRNYARRTSTSPSLALGRFRIALRLGFLARRGTHLGRFQVGRLSPERIQEFGEEVTQNSARQTSVGDELGLAALVSNPDDGLVDPRAEAESQLGDPFGVVAIEVEGIEQPAVGSWTSAR